MTVASTDSLQEALRRQSHIADRGLATAAFLVLRLQRPLFLEGEPGVGRTEVIKATTGDPAGCFRSMLQ
jgi:MoxR-like ATPase